MRRKIESAVRSRRAVLVASLGALLWRSAAADLVAGVDTNSAVAGKSEDALIAANPVLERLGRENPTLLREVIDRLRSPVRSHRRTLTYDAPRPATDAENTILTENPDLAVFYRESPEAALDLLRLIREAAKTKE